MIGVCLCSDVRRVCSHWRVSRYVWESDLCCGRYAAIAKMAEPVFGVRRAMARYGWYSCGMQSGWMVWYAFLWIASIVPPEHRLVSLL